MRTSQRSQKLLGMLKTKTGLTPNVMGRFAICLSLKDPSPPNVEEFDEFGSELNQSVLFGDYEDLFMALMIQRLIKDKESLDTETLNKMLRAHFNRGVIALYARIHSLSDFYTMIKQERLS